jgi:hemerythrin-like domain-containing protein
MKELNKYVMERYNIFYQVHKGLREMLYQAASRLQQTDFNYAEEASLVVTELREILDLFDKHADTEDNYILPLAEAYEPSVVNLFAEEHVQDHLLSSRIRRLLNSFNQPLATGSTAERDNALRVAFVEFMVFNLCHMAKEETVLNNILWRYYTDDQLKEVTQKIVAVIPPGILNKYNTWMMRGLSNNEIIYWLKGVKNSAPEFVFAGLLGLAEELLPRKRWMMVQEGITEGAMVA